MTGKEQIVLVEKYNPRSGLARGYGQHYIPVNSNQQKIHITSLYGLSFKRNSEC